MPEVFTGKVIIPAGEIPQYLAALKVAEAEIAPFREQLEEWNKAFETALTAQFSARTARKHAQIVEMFIHFLCGYTDVKNIHEVTVGMANSQFRSWYARKVLDNCSASELKTALKKFFQFLADNQGIKNEIVLKSFKK